MDCVALIESLSLHPLSLTLLMLGVRTNYHDLSFSTNETTINTNFFHRRTNFHRWMDACLFFVY